jgi:ribose-phosphate pyrophosphokinase
MIKVFYPTAYKMPYETVKFLTFSGGEEHVHLEKRDNLFENHPLVIHAQLLSSKDILQLLLTTNALKQLYPHHEIQLFLPYIPYARQDRVCFPGDAFSLEVFASLINSQGYSKVTVVDAHSSVSLQLINNCVEKAQQLVVPLITSRVKDINSIVSPDKGATVKTKNWVDAWTMPVQLVQAGKRRDSLGKIVATELYLDSNSQPLGNCLIVDDICDGGRTFIELAKVLYREGATQVYLYVTHGIFSQGVQVLKDNGISKVFTTDTFPEKDDGRIVVKRFFY